MWRGRIGNFKHFSRHPTCPSMPRRPACNFTRKCCSPPNKRLAGRSQQLITTLGGAERNDIVAGESWPVENLSERPGASLVDIAVHGRIDMVAIAKVLEPRTAARTVGHFAGHVEDVGTAICGLR